MDDGPKPTRVRRTFRVTPQEDGRALGDLLAAHCPEAPIGFLNRLIRNGLAQVSGVAADRKTALRAGQRVDLRLPDDAFLVAPNADVPFRVVHEDADLIVVDKPAGVVTEPGIRHKLDTLLNGLIARYGAELDSLGPERDFGMAHRLDREASGLLVVARRAETHRALVAAFRKREVDKIYLALLVGRLEKDAGHVRIPLGRLRRRGRAVAQVAGPGAQPAHTEFRVVRRFADATLVEARPHTGRWRQLRLHFAALGHPIAGDGEEGDAQANARFAERWGLRRMFLHATRLGFTHPTTGRKARFESPLPEELADVLARLSR